MPRHKRSKKLGRRRNRGRPINDVPMNDTNIQVRFRKALTFQYVANQSVIPLSVNISVLTQDLGAIYKQYRVTALSFVFQAAEITSATQTRYAINYVPSLETPPATGLSIDDYEGVAVGFWQDQRGTPYRYRVPSNVLNAMPLNWYETKAPNASEAIQGMIYSTCSTSELKITCLMEITVEYQTLLDTDFLASIGTHFRPQQALMPAPVSAHAKVLEDWEDVQSESQYPPHQIGGRTVPRQARFGSSQRPI